MIFLKEEMYKTCQFFNCEAKSPLLGNLRDLYFQYQEESLSKIEPKIFFSIFEKLTSFKCEERQDSHEFFELLLDLLVKELNKINYFRSDESNLFSKLFFGEETSTISCDVCGNRVEKKEQFLTLNLVVPKTVFHTYIKYFPYKDDDQDDLQFPCETITIEITGSTQIIDAIRKIKNIYHDNCSTEDFVAVLFHKKEKIKKILRPNTKMMDQIQSGDEIGIYKLKYSNKEYGLIYPVRLVSRNIRFLMYPILVQMEKKETLESYFFRVQKKLSLILKDRNQLLNISFYFYHYYNENVSFFEGKKKCKFCKDKETRLCPVILSLRSDSNLSVFFKEEPYPLVFLADLGENYDESSRLYLNTQNLLEKSDFVLMEENQVTLEDCIRKELEGTKIRDYDCTSCSRKVEASLSARISFFPVYLTFYLKRYQGNKENSVTLTQFIQNAGDNINHSFVFYQEFLKCFSEKCVYELFCVVELSNVFKVFPHYSCFCKEKEEWFKYDDQKKTRIKKENLVSKNAVLLFYRKM